MCIGVDEMGFFFSKSTHILMIFFHYFSRVALDLSANLF